MGPVTISAHLPEALAQPHRKYIVTDTGEAWRQVPATNMADAKQVGGLCVTAPEGGYSGNFRSWPHLLQFFANLRAQVYLVDGLE